MKTARNNFFIFLFFTGVAAVAAPQQAYAIIQSVYQDCADTTHFCGSSLTCVEKANASMVNIGAQKAICFPETGYAKCGVGNGGLAPKGDCSSLNNMACATISSIIDTTHFAASCVGTDQIPVKGQASTDCVTSDDCNVGDQCVRVSLPNASGTNTLYGAYRCISILDLPTNVVEFAGSCFTNKKCDQGQVCVRHIDAKTASNPFVCQQAADVKPASECTDKTTVGKDCKIDGAAGVCLHIFQGKSKPTVQCVRKETLVGGENAPSSQVCNNNKDCQTKTPDFPYCVFNPATKKNQCFSQNQIYTAMSLPSKGVCVSGTPSKTCTCTGPNITNCAGNGENSICTDYTGEAGTTICIHNQALGAGTTTQIATAGERMERPAPELEVTIPGLQFDKAIQGEATTGGTVFNVNYLATYINAVYKYGLGVGVLFAVFMLMVAGFRYMTAFGNAKATHTAMNEATNALLGLGLLFSAYTILYVIDPGLTKMKSIQVFAPKAEPYSFSAEADENEPDQPGQASPNTNPVMGTAPGGKPKAAPAGKDRVCTTVEACQPYCAGAKADPQKVEAKLKEIGFASPSNMIYSPKEIGSIIERVNPNCKAKGSNLADRYAGCGIYFRISSDPEKQQYFQPAVLEGLAIAATNALKAGYVLNVGSTYRSPLANMNGICDRLQTGKREPDGRLCGSEFACPFGSPHGQGYAMDVCLASLSKPSVCITPPTGKSRGCKDNLAYEHTDNKDFKSANMIMLNKIMLSSGWWKYCKENWHFEYTDNARDGNRTRDAAWTQ